ncbi:MAG: hypothetical protein ACJAS4_003217 [Bacteriovoracaceae bacterium]|jgi:hypothetical protein
MMKNLILCVAVMSLFSVQVFARGGGGKGKELRKAACEGKAQNDTCSFEGRKGSVTGVCAEGKRNPEILMCKGPKGGKKKRSE